MAISGIVLAIAVASGLAVGAPKAPAAVGIPGQAVYQVKCANCHGNAMAGQDFAPPLAGRRFLSVWQGKSARELYRRILSTMPADDPGSLEPATALAITGYILKQNDQAAAATRLEAPEDLNGVTITDKR